MAITSLRRAIATLSAVTVTLAVSQVINTTAVHAQDYSAILAAPDRSDADQQNDKRRDALKLLTFIGPKTNWSVLDMGAGAGYSTELMARAVGPTGKVWAQNDKANEKLEARLKTPAMSNAVGLVSSYDDPAAGLPPLDLITFLFAYHDTTYMEIDRAKMNKALFSAIKPGGVLVVADHSARPEDGANVGKLYHRVAEATLRSEVEAAGFKLIESADFLRNPDDPRTAVVFRSPIKVDEFV
ncbi:MAG: class I SAM-dependent methyltransferase, partial [Xanthobacteraceae bacterium]